MELLRGGRELPSQGVLHTVQGVGQAGVDPVGTMLAFHPCSECQKTSASSLLY